MKQKSMIGLIRVSTKEQGVAGNGLEAQRAAIIKFAEDEGYKLLDIVREECSGGLSLEDRPVLNEALERCQKQKAILVVSKLDRLSRDAAFILTLMNNTKAKFAVAQFGLSADPFMVHMYACLGEKERMMIGMRTKDALAVRKAAGVVLGNPTNLPDAREKAAKAVSDKADAFAAKMKTTIQRMLKTGMSYRSIAAELNQNGTRTARGGSWTPATISRMVERWNA